VVASELLCSCGGVDHHALACARRSDEDRSALGAGDRLERLGLLIAEARADPLGEMFARGVLEGALRNLPYRRFVLEVVY
jgi:hypothetical protein